MADDDCSNCYHTSDTCPFRAEGNYSCKVTKIHQIKKFFTIDDINSLKDTAAKLKPLLRENDEIDNLYYACKEIIELWEIDDKIISDLS